MLLVSYACTAIPFYLLCYVPVQLLVRGQILWTWEMQLAKFGNKSIIYAESL